MVMKFNANFLKIVNTASLGCPPKFNKYFSELTNVLKSYLEWWAVQKYPDQLFRLSVEEVLIKIKWARNGRFGGYLGLTT